MISGNTLQIAGLSVGVMCAAASFFTEDTYVFRVLMQLAVAGLVLFGIGVRIS